MLSILGKVIRLLSLMTKWNERARTNGCSRLMVVVWTSLLPTDQMDDTVVGVEDTVGNRRQ